MEIDTFQSKLVESLKCGVVQGSKLSSLLYKIYKCMSKDIYDNITNFKEISLEDKEKYKYVDYMIINYIDDSTNIISHNDYRSLKDYLTRYYSLLHGYYTANKLLINADKTELVVSCKNKYRREANKINFMAGKYKILDFCWPSASSISKNLQPR